MALHVGPAWTVPNGADFAFAWSTWASPPLVISGEPEGVALDIRLKVHVRNWVWSVIDALRLKVPSGEQIRIMRPNNAWADADTDADLKGDLGRNSTPFTFRDGIAHYQDRFQPGGVVLPFDGSVAFRPDEELWSLGFYSPVNGPYKLVIADSGSQAATGVPVTIPYWALDFRPFSGDVVTGRLNVGVQLAGVAEL